MSRARALVGVAVLAAFGAGIATGWLLATRTPPPGTPTPPAGLAEVVGQPPRPPELFGRVEAIRHLAQHGTAFLVRSTKPKLAGWDSEQNAHHRNTDMPCWVGLREGVPVRRRGAGAGEVAVGQTVSAWCSGPMATTMPPWWGGDFVVIEPDDR